MSIFYHGFVRGKWSRDDFDVAVQQNLRVRKTLDLFHSTGRRCTALTRIRNNVVLGITLEYIVLIQGDNG